MVGRMVVGSHRSADHHSAFPVFSCDVKSFTKKSLLRSHKVW